MNLVYEHPCVPLRVLLVDPTQDVMVMIAIKALRGVFFGQYQLVDLILLVYENDIAKAHELKWNLDAGAFPCNNSITITSEIPRINDADVFIFISNFTNLNAFDIDRFSDDEHFDSLYLFLKIANNLVMPPPVVEPEEKFKPFREAKALSLRAVRRPVIVTDGIVTLDIIKTFSRNLPNDIFFCPTSMASISKIILGEHLKVHVTDLNHVYVWAANDDVFHVDIESPVYRHQRSRHRRPCEWDVMSNLDFEALKMDLSQFNAAWLKKEFLQKVLANSSHHPHGCIYKAAKITNVLQHIWKTRSLTPEPESKANLGVVSDGSLETIKGLPYVLPVIFKRDTFTVNEHLKEDIYLKQEIKRINKVAWENHLRLKRYCKAFMRKNLIRREFIPVEEASLSDFTAVEAAGTSSVSDEMI